MRVCYFGTYRADYPRNPNMIAGLRAAGVEVIECQVPLWRDTSERVRLASGGWANPIVWLRLTSAYWRLGRMHSRLPTYDVMIAGYPGLLDVFLARKLSRQRGKPLVWDVYMSAYLIALDRGLGRRHALTIRLLRAIEARALRQPELLIIDTPEYVEWFVREYDIEPTRFRLVPPAADQAALERKVNAPGVARTLRVAYHGTFIPNHSVMTMLRAAQLLRDEADIAFEFIGEGPDLAAARDFARERGLARAEFSGWLQGEALTHKIESADICLGAFGGSGQSLITVHNKIYEALALGRPVISGDSPAVRRAFRAGEEIELIPREDPQALARAIRGLHADPLLRYRLGTAGRRAVETRFRVSVIGGLFTKHLREAMALQANP